MRKRVDDHTINTLSFQEKVAFSADAPHSVRLKRFPFDEIVPLHYAETMEIVLVKDVVGSIIVGKKSHAFLPQDVVIIPPYYVHSTNCKRNDGFLYNVKVSFEELKAFMNIPAIVEWDRRVLFRRLFMPEAYDEMMRIVQRLIEQDDDIFARMHCLLDLFYLIYTGQPERERGGSPARAGAGRPSAAPDSLDKRALQRARDAGRRRGNAVYEQVLFLPVFQAGHQHDLPELSQQRAHPESPAIAENRLQCDRMHGALRL